MGYDVHITRAKHWTESESVPIVLDEWLAYIDHDSEMRLDVIATAQVSDGAILEYENKGLAVWTRFSQHNIQGNMAWFDYRQGEIIVKNPDEEILGKMKAIARHFNAQVIGDDGESY